MFTNSIGRQFRDLKMGHLGDVLQPHSRRLIIILVAIVLVLFNLLRKKCISSGILKYIYI